MTYDGRAVANFVLDRCEEKGRAVSNLALQKIVYFCHAWHIAHTGRPLVKHQFEAWKYGPVLQYLYRDFKSFDDVPITTRACRMNPRSGESEVVSYEFDASTTEFLSKVVDFYSRLKAGTLVELSHTAGGPWDVVWNHGGDINPGMRIPDEQISQYFSGKQAPF